VIEETLKKTMNPNEYRHVVGRLNAREQQTLLALKNFFGEEVFWGVMTNPSLLFERGGGLIKLKTLLDTVDLYRLPDGSIDPEHGPLLGRYFLQSGKYSLSRMEVRTTRTGQIEVDEAWGLVQEFALMSRLKFSSPNPDAFMVGEEGRLGYSYAYRMDLDGFDIPRKAIHEAKNSYGTVTKEIFKQLERYGTIAKNRPGDVQTIEYDLVVYDNGKNNRLEPQLLEELSQRVQAMELSVGQRVVIRFFVPEAVGDEGGALVYDERLSYVFDAHGNVTLTTNEASSGGGRRGG
jgi:hypothetical protein